jgi:exosortase
MAEDQGPFRKTSTAVFHDRPLSAPYRGKWLSILAIAAGIVAVIAVWAYWQTFGDIFATWLVDADYTHGFFVVPISLWLLWLRRNEAPEPALTIDWRGLGLLALAAAIRCISGRYFLPQLDAWSIPVWIAGVVWLLFGWPMLRWALPSIAFLWFATPLPGTIEIWLSTPLQRLAASYSAWLLRLIGQPAIVEGTTILLDEHHLDVEQACSGLRMFYGIFALAFACIAIARPPIWKSVFVLCAAAPIAIIANVVRISATGLLMKYASNEDARHFTHNTAGIVMIPLAVTLFLLFLLLLGRLTRRLSEPGGVAWLIKWCVAGVVLLAGLLVWGHHQEARALSTLLDTALSYEKEEDWAHSIQYMSRYIRAVPEDLDTYTHLARLYQTRAPGYENRLRAVDLLRSAWKNQPQSEDLATSAIEIALEVQDFDDAIQIADELIAKSTQPATRNQAMRLRAEALYKYLQSDKTRGDYSWDNVKEAFEKELKLPDYDVTHAMYLAEVYRNRPISIKSDQRVKLASALLDRVIAERAAEPMAWLARFQYRALNPADAAKAESDLTRAVELAEKNPKNPSTVNVLLTAADYKRSHGDEKQAVALLQRVIEIAPKNSAAYLMLFGLKRGERTKQGADEAIAILQKGYEQNEKRDWDISYYLGIALAESGKLQEAEAVIAPIESMMPQLIGRMRNVEKLRVGLIRGRILLARDGPQAALNYLRPLLNDPEVRLTEQQSPADLASGFGFLAQLYSARALNDLALDAYRQAARIQPSVPEWQIRAAAMAQQTGDLDSADRDFRAFIEKGRASGDVLAAYVEVEIKRQLQLDTPQRDWNQAKRLLGTAQQSGASPLTVRLLAAEILRASGELDKAEKLIVKLTEEKPGEPSCWRALAVFRLQKNDAKGAMAAAAKFADVTNQSIDSATLKASILATSGRADDAVKELSAALAKAPPAEKAKAALALSDLFMKSGKPNDARTTLEKAHEADPKNLQIVDTLANVAWLGQDWKELEKCENWLKTIEGNDGTIWRSYRAQRLLANASSVGSEEFQAASAEVDAIVRDRPRWSKAQFLKGEIAYRMNRLDSASDAYERAWQLGGRGILLADRLLDLLTRQQRFDDARRFVAQARDYLNVSPGLFDRAIPYLAKGNESQDIAHMAQQWVDKHPDDSEAHLRLGRVKLMLSNSSTENQKQKLVEEAKAEFQRAIELAPNDVRPWAGSVMLYSESPATRDQALKTLEEFSKQAKINELERNFVLAQLYDLLGLPAKAQHFFSQAGAIVEADPKAKGGARVLGRAARFYISRAPVLAELYARRTVDLDPANLDARFVLLNVCVNRTDAQSAEEGIKLLDEGKAKDLLDPALEARYRAFFLARRGRPDDVNAAIDLLRRYTAQAREDKLLLARLYEQAGQTAPSLEVLQQLARSPNANSAELIAFLQFWQQHFVVGADPKATVQFSALAKDVYQRLAELPNQLPEYLRYRLRELKVRQPKARVTNEGCEAILSDVLATPSAKNLSDKDKRQLMQVLFYVLMQENCDDCAIHFATTPQNGLTPADLAIWLCNAYIAVPATSESEPKRKQTMEKLLAANSTNADVQQAVGDCSFMAADYEKAIEAYRHVLALRPNHQMAHNNLALALVETHRAAEARQVLAEALNAKANDPDLLDTQATIDIVDHHPDVAIETLERLVEKHPDSPVLRFHLAAAYDDMKNSAQAKENLFAATALGVSQRLLSPRDKKTMEQLKARYISPNATTIADQHSSAASQTRD